jgi:hypothetical protein
VKRFEMDAAAERSTGRLRLGAAIVTLAAVFWLATSDPGMVGWAMAVLGTLVSAGWLESYRRSRRRAAQAARHYLEIADDGLTLAEGEREHHIAWTEMRAVEVDEERLAISVFRAVGAPLTIHPRYRGISLEELAAAIREGREGATGAEMVK